MTEKHRFIVVFLDTPDGARGARRAVNRWLFQGLFDESVWTTLYERIEALNGGGTPVILAALVDIDTEEE